MRRPRTGVETGCEGIIIAMDVLVGIKEVADLVQWLRKRRK